MDWANLRVRFHRGGKSQWAAGRRLEEDWFRMRMIDYALWFIDDGEGFLKGSEETIKLHAGTCIWFRPGRVFQAWQKPGSRMTVAHIHFDLIDPHGEPLSEEPNLPVEVHEAGDVQFYRRTMNKIVELARASVNLEPEKRELVHLQIGHLMQGLLMDIELKEPVDHSRTGAGTGLRHRRMISKVVRQIYQNPSHTISVAELAVVNGLSVEHFVRVFREIVGMPPKQFILRTRIDQAESLLRHSEMTVGQVAESLGYNNIFFFSKQFKDKTGLTPTAYRRRKVLATRHPSDDA